MRRLGILAVSLTLAPGASFAEDVAIEGGTVITVGPAGTIENGTILVSDGKIAAVGTDLAVPRGARRIDATGRFVTPGLIDAHSHTAIEGSGNECTNSVTAEVWIGDVLDHRSIDIYRQLAGGVTTAHIMHGSCNAIGGQNATIKLRWGKGPEQLLFEGAARTIKFALGENPKRSNFRRPGARRYPGTRMGVEVVIREAFEKAAAYRREWQEYEKRKTSGEDVVAPRKDIQLDALVGILEGEILVHSHCYRTDEILMLIGVAEDFGFRIGTFQHVLEGYKVASEIAAHGAAASTFSDWWGYKLEAYDATPYNAAIMHDHGIVVSLNSDSSELARRLYWEAAKAVKYGGVDELEALKMVTLNSAVQLGVDSRVGSIEAGKDADLAIFSAHPFDPSTRVEMTLVDGEVLFDRSEDSKRRAAIEGGGK